MGEMLRSRVRDRIADLGTNPFEVARKAGLERSFINDLLIGKKQTIRESKLPAVADALECDIGYLTGVQPEPRISAGETDQSADWLPISGICEAGAFREIGIPLAESGLLPIDPDPRFSRSDQSAYLVRGDHAAGLGIPDASVICIVASEAAEEGGKPLRDGDPVLVERTRGDTVELSARVFRQTREGIQLIAKPARGVINPISPSSDVRVIGPILRALKVFGLPS